MVLLPSNWRRGSKDPRGRGVKRLLSNDFIIVMSILSTFAILKGMSAAAFLIYNVKQDHSSSEDTFVMRFIDANIANTTSASFLRHRYFKVFHSNRSAELAASP